MPSIGQIGGASKVVAAGSPYLTHQVASRVVVLDGLRLVAATMVVFYHYVGVTRAMIGRLGTIAKLPGQLRESRAGITYLATCLPVSAETLLHPLLDPQRVGERDTVHGVITTVRRAAGLPELPLQVLCLRAFAVYGDPESILAVCSAIGDSAIREYDPAGRLIVRAAGQQHSAEPESAALDESGREHSGRVSLPPPRGCDAVADVAA